MNVPIVIICKDRIKYLDLEVKSISATCPSSTQVIISNDGSKNQRMHSYLKTQKPIITEYWSFPRGNPEWDNLIGHLPDQNPTGIRGKTKVIFRDKSAGTKNLGLAVRYAFEKTGASHVIKMEDDLAFIQGWYSTIIKSITHSKCDLVSGFRYFYGKPETRHHTNLVEEVYKGYTGGQLMICSRKYYEKCPCVFNNDITTIWDNDDLWINQCRKNGMMFGVVKKSVCQHIGFQTESKQKEFTKNGKLLKVDHEVKGLVFGKEIRKFRDIV